MLQVCSIFRLIFIYHFIYFLDNFIKDFLQLLRLHKVDMGKYYYNFVYLIDINQNKMPVLFVSFVLINHFLRLYNLSNFYFIIVNKSLQIDGFTKMLLGWQEMFLRFFQNFSFYFLN